MEKIKKFLKSDIVFAVSAILAFVSCFFVHPSKDYVGYIDFKTLSLLFCLMITVCGFRSINVFTALGNVLSKKADTNRKITFFMVILCFFSSMFITNDVALITFVPFTIFFLKSVNESKSIGKIVILETISANLGSMLTPVGNPQNLYIYSISNMSVGKFIGTMLPLSTVSLVLVLILCITIKNKKFEVENTENNKIVVDKKGVVVYGLLFLLCIGCVLHILNYIYLFVRELARTIRRANVGFTLLTDKEFDHPMGASTGAGVIFGTTGGVMEAALRSVYEIYTGRTLENVNFEQVRGLAGVRRATIDLDGFELKVGIAHGLGNARQLLEDIRHGRNEYHVIEIMACPGGCIGGGGQPLHHGNSEVLYARANALYREDAQSLCSNT